MPDYGNQIFRKITPALVFANIKFNFLSKIPGCNAPASCGRPDFADLVARRALVRSGEQRQTRYGIAIPMRPVLPVAIDEHGNFK